MINIFNIFIMCLGKVQFIFKDIMNSSMFCICNMYLLQCHMPHCKCEYSTVPASQMRNNWENGVLVNSGYNMTVQSGQIALQAEGSEVEFRKVVLTPISKIKN